METLLIATLSVLVVILSATLVSLYSWLGDVIECEEEITTEITISNPSQHD